MSISHVGEGSSGRVYEVYDKERKKEEARNQDSAEQ